MWRYNGLLDFIVYCFPPPQHKETFLLKIALKVKDRIILCNNLNLLVAIFSVLNPNYLVLIKKLKQKLCILKLEHKTKRACQLK